MSDIIEEWLRC